MEHAFGVLRDEEKVLFSLFLRILCQSVLWIIIFVEGLKLYLISNQLWLRLFASHLLLIVSRDKNMSTSNNVCSLSRKSSSHIISNSEKLIPITAFWFSRPCKKKIWRIFLLWPFKNLCSHGASWKQVIPYSKDNPSEWIICIKIGSRICGWECDAWVDFSQ